MTVTMAPDSNNTEHSHIPDAHGQQNFTNNQSPPVQQQQCKEQQQQQQHQHLQLQLQPPDEMPVDPSPHQEDTESRSPSRSFRRQVTFPDDSSIATVHHLEPAPSAGDGSSCQHCDSDADSLSCWQRFKAAVKQLKRDIVALYYAVHDPRTPWLSKLLPWLVLAYALSPLDLVPDFIPVLGVLDDLILLPLGLWVSYKLIPAQVMQDSRAKAAVEPLLLERNWLVATIIFSLWGAGLLLLGHWLTSCFGSPLLQQFEWAVLGGTGIVALAVYLVWMVQRVKYERRLRQGGLNAPLLEPTSGDRLPGASFSDV